ncbi:MAG: hypothetical protein IJZ29_03055 [Clostridia bacterium]|nr:hypothetical protein [Clostridia bacterium]
MANYFRNTYRYLWENTESIEKIVLNQNVANANTIKFTIPTLQCQAASANGFFTIAEMNTVTRIYRQNVINGVIQPQKTLILERVSGATSFNARNDEVAYITGGSSGTLQLRNINGFSYEDEGKAKYKSFSERYSTFSQIAHASSSFNNKEVSFDTTPLSEDDIAEGKSFFYSIECVCLPDNNAGLLSSFTATHRGYHVQSAVIGIINVSYYEATLTTGHTVADPNAIKISTSFYCLDMSSTAEGGPFLMKGVKYNTYQLFRKAMLTVDTQIIDNSITGLDENYLQNSVEDPNNIQYPIIIDDDPSANWKNRMKSTQLYETVLETKNLWEVFQQIGKYLHAEPVLNFARDGTDRFMLSFKQLGKNEISEDKSQKITIYNSQALSQFFSSYDSYVTNLFSPQNLCKQSIVVKCSDGSYLISNDNSELNSAYNINEIVEFNICCKVGDQYIWKDAMKAQVVNDNGDIVKLSSKIYEKSIFDILTSEQKVSPSKADSLYFTMGDSKIQNLTYVPPTSSAYEEPPMALKKIIRQLFGIPTNSLNFNELIFEIVYRTQDTVRLTQARPDMEIFIKNSSYEKYPHHEQYYNQLDKIPDSERFSANMWGQLVRSGNSIIQCQEYCAIGEEKEEGDLYMIDGLPYYVVKVESEYYNDCILQKVTYSAYWNETSMITSQNSENRMYEVSERSMTRREKREMEFLKISSAKTPEPAIPRFLNNLTGDKNWKRFIKDLIFCENQPVLPNYAYVKFMADRKRQHTGSFGQYVEPDYLFPSSEIDRIDPNNIKPKASKSYSEVIVPVLRFPKKDGLLLEFDMEDNFKAGDYVDTTINGTNVNGNAYFAQQPVRYVDIMGRADLYQFKLFYRKKEDIDLATARALLKAPFVPTDEESQVLLSGNKSIALDKDCREALSFNFQINLLDTDIEFITFSNLFGDKNARLKLMAYNKTLGMFDQVVNLASGTIVADDIPYTLIDDDENNQIQIKISHPDDLDLDNVKSLIWYDDNNGVKDIYLVTNVDKLPNEEKLKDRFIYPVFSK